MGLLLPRGWLVVLALGKNWVMVPSVCLGLWAGVESEDVVGWDEGGGGGGLRFLSEGVAGMAIRIGINGFGRIGRLVYASRRRRVMLKWWR